MRRIAVIAVLLAGCSSPAIESYCETTEDGVDCSFTNMGGKGEACVEVTLTGPDGKTRTKTDKPICSGAIDKMGTANVSGTFADPQPSEVCKNSEGDLDWDNCKLEVKTLQ
jgi:hypothetical protein